ncbi:hypothetical protein ACE60T_001665 [Salmonella enterica]
MFNLKRIVYIPLCLLLFSASSFSGSNVDDHSLPDLSDLRAGINERKPSTKYIKESDGDSEKKRSNDSVKKLPPPSLPE